MGFVPGRGTTEKTAEGMQEALRLALLGEWRRQDLQFKPSYNCVGLDGKTRDKQRGAI